MSPGSSPADSASSRSPRVAGARTVAAIDVGANAVRMVIAEVLPDGRIEVSSGLQRAVRLGQDTFRRGRLGAASMRAAVAILRDYPRSCSDLYKSSRSGPSPPPPPAKPATPTPSSTASSWPPG